MGFNPHRKRVKRTSDFLIVGSAFVIIVALLLWAFAG
jgi:hypothetical protein